MTTPFPTCELCGCELEYEDCPLCGGDGYLDAHDDDPFWYDIGALEPCPDCDEAGGWWFCPNAKTHPAEVAA